MRGVQILTLGPWICGGNQRTDRIVRPGPFANGWDLRPQASVLDICSYTVTTLRRVTWREG